MYCIVVLGILVVFNTAQTMLWSDV